MPSPNQRININDTIKMSLLNEVHGCCPLCRNDLVVKENGKHIRVFDIAHIYPLNPTDDELELLKNAERIANDVNSEENFVPLCKKCHKIYDTNKTLEEYLELVEIKKNILKIKKLNRIWDAQTLHSDITKIAESISALTEDDIKNTKLSHEALKLSEKKDDTLGIATEVKVAEYIKLFYIPIQKSFKMLEKENTATTNFIFSQVKSYYTLLTLYETNKKNIFDKMCDWFMKKTGITDSSKSEVLVSFFIQNCEVFSNANA